MNILHRSILMLIAFPMGATATEAPQSTIDGAVAIPLAEPVATGSIKVTVSKLRNNQGQISIGLFNTSDSFPKRGKRFRGQVAAVSKQKGEITFNQVPAGTYALAVIHDENANNDLDTNFIGIPTEGYGFSNNAFGTFGPPSFEDASFKVASGQIAQNLVLKY
jgi:uncharacterized protein (DUF2141 family)